MSYSEAIVAFALVSITIMAFLSRRGCARRASLGVIQLFRRDLSGVLTLESQIFRRESGPNKSMSDCGTLQYRPRREGVLHVTIKSWVASQWWLGSPQETPESWVAVTEPAADIDDALITCWNPRAPSRPTCLVEKIPRSAMGSTTQHCEA